ncbi:hypothetical protein [Bdellovibrio sp. BCCA]|uniref:hypothetical protein n=1 Tax=Bdellovibrio sp. BCCA TaxID=3136281 RepID=UPI0030F26F88
MALANSKLINERLAKDPEFMQLAKDAKLLPAQCRLADCSDASMTVKKISKALMLSKLDSKYSEDPSVAEFLKKASNHGSAEAYLKRKIIRAISADGAMSPENGAAPFLKENVYEYLTQQAGLTKKAADEFLEDTILDPVLRENYKSYVSSLKVQASDYVDLDDGASNAYEGGQFRAHLNRVEIGTGNLLLSRSHISVIGHELGHRIDPCYNNNLEYTATMNSSLRPNNAEGKYPFKEVVSCLRSPESIYAQPVGKPRTNEICFGFSTDRIAEAFCDWFGVELMVKTILDNPKLTQQEKKDLLEQEMVFGATRTDIHFYGDKRDVHSSFKDRINKIYFAHPKIRAIYGCSNEEAPRYCKPPSRYGVSPTSSEIKSFSGTK